MAIGGGIAYSLIRPPVYKATSSIAFNEANAVLDRIGGIVNPPFAPEKIAAGKLGGVTSPAVMRLASESLKDDSGIEIGLRPLRTRIEANVNPESNLVEVNARAGTGEAAVRIANAVAEADVTIQNELVRAEFADQASALEDELSALQKNQKRSAIPSARELDLQATITRLNGAAEIATVAELVEPAAGEVTPETPRPIRDTLLAAFLGLLLGIGAAIVRESLDRRLHSAAEIQNELELPVIGLVRASAMGKAAFSTKGSKPLDERDVEAYRILRNNLAFLDVDREPRSVIVTSGLPEEGKSTVAASLAQAGAAAGVRTLLLECDLRRPSLPDRLGLAREPGLTDYLTRRCETSDILQQISVPGAEEGTEAAGSAPLTYIAAGSPSPRPAEALGSNRFKELLNQAMDTYELVVIDTSPLLSVVDTRELVPLVDAVLLCIRVSRTSRDQMLATKATLDLFPARPVGVVITAVRQREEPDYGYYSYAY